MRDWRRGAVVKPRSHLTRACKGHAVAVADSIKSSSVSHHSDLLPGLLAALRMVREVHDLLGGQEASIRGLIVLVRLARGERIA